MCYYYTRLAIKIKIQLSSQKPCLCFSCHDKPWAQGRDRTVPAVPSPACAQQHQMGDGVRAGGNAHPADTEGFVYPVRPEEEIEEVLLEVKVCLFLFTCLYISKTHVKYLKVKG